MLKRDQRYAARTNENTIGRKSKRNRKGLIALSAAAGLVGAAASSTTKAATFDKANNLTPLSQGASWVGGTAPSIAGTDLAQFNSTYATAGTLSLGAAIAWSGLQVVAGEATPIFIQDGAAANTLTLNASGIDMSGSSVSVTDNAKTFFNASQHWNVATGTTLTLGGTNDAVNNSSTISIDTTGTSNGTILINGNITGGGTLVDNVAASNLQLGNVNALQGFDFQYAAGGLTFVNGITSENIGSLEGAGNITLNNNAAAAVALIVGANGENSSYTGVLSGKGSLNYAGGATFGLTQNQTYLGSTTISGTGTLQLGNGLLTTGNLPGAATAGGWNVTGAISDAGTLFIDIPENATLSGAVSGAGSVTTNLQGGTLDLAVANTFTGLLSIATGDTVFVGNPLALQTAVVNFSNGYTGSLAFAAGSTAATIGGLVDGTGVAVAIPNTAGFALTLGNGNANVNDYWGTISGGSATGHVTVNPSTAGTVILSGANSLAGTLTVSSGVLQFGTGGATGWSPNFASIITDFGTLVFDLNTPTTITNTLYGSTGSIQYGGSSSITLTASNSYGNVSGTTEINGTGNTVILGNASALAGTTLFYNNFGGALSFGTLTNATLGALAGGQALALTNTGGAAVALSIGNNGQLNTYTGAFSGTGSVTKVGTGVEVLASTTSNYSGGTTITSGQLTLTNANSLGAPTSGILASIMNNGTLSTSATGGFATLDGLALSNNNTLLLQGSTLQINGPMVTLVPGLLTVEGGGTLILSNLNPSFNDGIQIGNAATASPASLTIGSGITGSGSIATLGALEGGQQITDNGTLTFNLPGTNSGPFNQYTLSTILNGTGNLSQVGLNSILVLNAANTYTGNTTIGAGGNQTVLQLNNNAALGKITSNGILTVNANGTLDMHGFSTTVGALTGGGIVDDLTAVPSILTIGNALNAGATFGGTLQNSTAALSIVIAGTGTQAFTGLNTYTGSTAINSGILQVNNFYSTQTNGTFNLLPNQSSLGNTSSVTIAGATLEMLANTNGFTTSVPIHLQSTGSTIQVDNNIPLLLAGTIFELDGPISDGTASGTLNKTGGGTLVLTGINSYSGPTVITAGALQIGNGVTGGLSALGVSTAAITDNGSLVFDLGASATFSGLVTGTGSFVQDGTNTFSNTTTTLVLSSNNNTYTGNTIVQAGTLLLGNQLAIQSSTLNYNNQGGIFSFGTLTTAVFGGLSGAQNLALTNTNSQAVSLTVGTNNSNVAYSGNLTDGGAGASLTKVGTGAFILSGTGNNFTGGTFVNEGLLEFTQSGAIPSTAAGNITVNAGGAVGLDSATINSGTLKGFINASSTGAVAITAIDNGSTINEATALPGTHMSLGAGNGGITFTGSILPNAGTYYLGGGETLTLPNTNQLTSTNNVVIENGGAVRISGLNNYTGSTSINGNYATIGALTTVTPYVNGVLQVAQLSNGGNASTIGQSTNAAGNLVINGGVFDYIGPAATTDRLFTIGSAGATLTSAGSGPVTFTNTGDNVTANTGLLTGNVSSGSAVITNVNTNGLQVGFQVFSDTDNDLSNVATIVSISGNTVTISAPATGNGAGDTIDFEGQNRNLVLNGSTPNNFIDSNLHDSQTDQVSGFLSVVEAGGSWILAGTNDYSGPTVLEAGGELGFASPSAQSINTTLEFEGGLLQITGTTTTHIIAPINQTTFNGGYDIATAANVFTVQQNLSGTGSFIKTGLGTLVITGSNTYTGSTTVNEGTLNVQLSSFNNPIGSLSAVVLGGFDTFNVNGSNTTAASETPGSTTLVAGHTNINVNDVGFATTFNTAQIAANVGATAYFTNTTLGTLTIGSIVSGGTSTSSILTTANGAPYAIIGTNWAAAAAATGGVVGPLLTYTTVASGTSALGTNGNLDFVNSGEMRASGNVTEESIRFNNPLGGYYVGASANYPVFSNGAIVSNTTTVTYDQIYIKSTDLMSVGGFLMTPNTGTMNVYITDDTGNVISEETNPALDNYRSVSGNAGNEITIFQQNTQAGIYIMSAFLDRGGTSLVKDGAGTVYMLSQVSEETGPTYLNGGYWAITADSGLGGYNTSSTGIQMTNPAILNGGYIQALGTFSLNNGAPGSNDRPIILGTGAINGGIDVTNTNVLTVTGLISGSGALTKTDTGTLLLSPFAPTGNTYSGGTYINGGNVQVDQSTGLATGVGAVNINNTGTLIGVGTINNIVNINSGGTLSPGDPGLSSNVGTFTIGSLDINCGGIVAEDELGGTSSQDMVDVENALSAGAGSQINLLFKGTTNALDSAGTYTLFTVDGPVSGLANLTVADPQPNVTSYTFGSSVTNGVTSVTITMTGGSVSGQWNNPSGGGWNVASNWVGGQIPSGVDAFALFGAGGNPLGTAAPGITAAHSVDLNGNQTVGFITFANPNSYTIDQGAGGSLFLDAGTQTSLVTDNLGSHTISAPVQLNSNLNIAVNSPNSTDTLTVSGPISSKSGATTNLTVSGTGTVILSGNNTYTGLTTINSGLPFESLGEPTLQIGAGGTTGSLGTNTGAVIDNGSLVFDVNGAVTVANAIISSNVSLVPGVNAGVLTQDSPTGGSLLLTGTNTYIGATNILSGTLSMGNASSLGANQDINVVLPGILDINGNNVNLQQISGNGTIDNVTAGGNPTITIGSNNLNTTWTGVMADTTGSVNIVKAGSGITTFANTNTYVGQTTIGGSGSIEAGITNAISPNSTILVQDTDGIILAPGVTISSPMLIAGGLGAEVIDVPTGNATYAGNISFQSGGGTQYRMGISGTGSLTLTGANGNYTSNAFFFITRGNVVFAQNGSANIPGATFGLGRFSLSAQPVQVLMENNATVTAAGLSSGEGQAMTGMDLFMQDNAVMTINGGFDMEDSTLTSSTGQFILNGGMLGAGFFFQTMNSSSPGQAQNGFGILPGGVIDGTYMFLNGGVLEQTIQSGTNAFLPTINDLSLVVQNGGALFNSNGNRMIVQTPLSDQNGLASNSGGQFQGDGGVQKLGLGTLVLSGTTSQGTFNSNYLGPTIVQGGLLELVDQNSLGGFHQANAAANLSFGGYTPSVTVNKGGAAGFEGGTISGANSSFFIGVLEQANGVGEPTQINFGGLALDPNDAAVNIDYTGTVGGGSFNMSNASIVHMSIGALSAGVTYTGTITPAASTYDLGGGGTLTLPNNNQLTGVGNSVLYENGGVVQTNGTDNYGGTTTIQGSYIYFDPHAPTQIYQPTTLSINAIANGGAASSLGSSSNAAANLVLDGGVLEYTGAGGSTDRLMTITSAGGTINSSGTGAVVFSNTNTEVSADAANQVGSVTGATISGIDTHQLGIGMVVSDSLDGFNNATITGITPNSVTLGTNSFAAQSGDTFTFGNQIRTLTLTGTNANQNILDSNLVDGGALNVVKSGTGTWYLAGSNGYTGGTTINGGVLQVSTNASMGNLSGATTINSGTLEALNSITTSRNFFTGATNATIQVDGASTYEIDGTITNAITNATTTPVTTFSGALIVSGTGKLLLTGSNTYTGGTTIRNGAILQLGNGNTSGFISGNIADAGTLNFDRSDSGSTALNLTGTISGTGTVNQIGTGTTILSGGNIYNSTTNITAGTLEIDNIGSLPTNNNVANASNLNIFANSQSGNITGSGTTEVVTGIVLQTNSITQPTLSNPGTTIFTTEPGMVAAASTLGTITGGGNLSVSATSGGVTVTGSTAAIQLTNNGSFTTNGAATIPTVLGTGTITIGAAGGLNAVNLTQYNSTSLNGGIVNNGQFTLTGLGTIGTITGTGSTTIAAGATLMLSPGNLPLTTHSNSISTQNSLTLQGAGSNMGTLDLTTNSLVINYGGNGGSYNPAIEGTVRSEIINAFDGGNWDGHGITSSVAEADAASGGTDIYQGNAAVGYADNNFLGNPSIPTNSVLVRFTLYGDADLNGLVNLDDFNDWLAGFSDPTDNPDNWVDGDFLYEGNVNLDDFTAWLASFQANEGNMGSLVHDIQVSTLSSAQQQVLLNMVNAVPEPASIGLIGMAAVGLLPRRRRRQK